MATDVFSLNNQVALVTGGGTGIGYGISQAMIEAGATVVITGRREAVLQEAAQRLGERCHYLVNDITVREEIPRLVQTITERHGPVDILVNNAGIHLKKPAQETGDEEFERILQTNLISVFHKAIDSDPDRKQQIVNRIAMPGFGEPSDVGHAAVFLSSAAARYITGVVLPVDGGATVNF